MSEAVKEDLFSLCVLCVLRASVVNNETRAEGKPLRHREHGGLHREIGNQQTSALCAAVFSKIFRIKIMQKPAADEYPTVYQKYFDLVPAGDFLSLLDQNSIDTIEFFENIPTAKVDYRYAEGKWTVKQVLMHLIDTERVFSYRALAGARGDAAPHYRMDEELYAGSADVSRRDLASLLAEFRAVRSSTEQLFENLSDAQTKLTCNIMPYPMTVRAIGYFLIAHVRHHLGVIRQRYL
jgi:uncharacterized damage-inducible protein DinB